MSSVQQMKLKRRHQRQSRVRGQVRGNAERPRLAVFRSGKHIYAQIIDDAAGRTLAAASSMQKSLREQFKHGGNINAATAVGRTIAEKAKESGISLVAFDREGYRYHGRVKALAEAAREAGLKF